MGRGNGSLKRVLSTLLTHSVLGSGTERLLSCFIRMFAVGRRGISLASAVVPGSITGTCLFSCGGDIPGKRREALAFLRPAELDPQLEE
jgi:hypothetical protein